MAVAGKGETAVRVPGEEERAPPRAGGRERQRGRRAKERERQPGKGGPALASATAIFPGV